MKMTPEELFESFAPDLGDKDRYVEELAKKLRSYEMLHKICEENARKTKSAVLMAVVIGLLLGGFIMAVIILNPMSGMDFHIKLGIRVLNFSIRYAYIALLMLAAVPVCLFISLPILEQKGK